MAELQQVRKQLGIALEWLRGDSEERQYQAAFLIRVAVENSERKPIARDLGVIAPLVDALQRGGSHPTSTVAVEALACLLCDDPIARDEFRLADGHQRLLALLDGSPGLDVAHRVLLVMQVITDKDVDRREIVARRGAPLLVRYLDEDLGSDILEHALSSVCNLAAGQNPVKQALCDAGAIAPLLATLAQCVDRSLAQLAALALRNLSRNPKCREEVVRLNGVATLIDFLSEGLSDLHYPLRCEAHYQDGSAARNRVCNMAVDVDRGQLILSAEPTAGCCGMKSTPSANLHKDAAAERYSLMMKAMRFSLPSARQLELCFNVDGTGVSALGPKNKKTTEAQLLKVTVDECDAQEISELLTKLLNKLYTQQDFKMVPRPSNYPSSMLSGVASGVLASSPTSAPRDKHEALSLELVKPSVLA